MKFLLMDGLKTVAESEIFEELYEDLRRMKSSIWSVWADAICIANVDITGYDFRAWAIEEVYTTLLEYINTTELTGGFAEYCLKLDGPIIEI